MYHDICKYIIGDNVFYNSKCRIAWVKLKKILDRGDNIDMISFCGKLTDEDRKGGCDEYFITGVSTESPSKLSIEYYAKTIYEKYLMRNLIVSSRSIIDKAYSGEEDVYDLLGQSHSSIGNLLEQRPTVIFDISELAEMSIENIKNKDNTVRFGFDGIDKCTGGMTKGEITIIGGRPSHGKTTFGMNVVSNLLDNNNKVMIINREMTNVEMMNKIMVLESGRLSYKMLRQKTFTDDDFKELEITKKKVSDKYNKDSFIMFDNIPDFGTAASEIKKFKPDVVFDDYVQLIKPITEMRDRRLQIEEIVNNYKWIAKSLGCVVILISQLNRAIESRINPKPRMSDLAESGSLEQAAENVIFIYYDYRVNYEDSESGKEKVEIIAGKVRYGESGRCQLGYNGDKCKYYDEVDDDIPF